MWRLPHRRWLDYGWRYVEELGGAYVKVKTNDNGRTFEFMDDSPLKTYDEIMQKMQTSVVTLLIFPFDASDRVLSCFLNDHRSGEINLIDFCGLSVLGNNLIVEKVSIDSDNKITFSVSRYTLTPAT